MAYYARGNYDDAVNHSLRGADLNPADPDCYLFLSKAYNSSRQAEDVIARFRRFASSPARQCQGALLLRYESVEGQRAEDAGLDLNQIETLLKSLGARPKIRRGAFCSFGNLYSDQNQIHPGHSRVELLANSIQTWPMSANAWAKPTFAPARRI